MQFYHIIENFKVLIFLLSSSLLLLVSPPITVHLTVAIGDYSLVLKVLSASSGTEISSQCADYTRIALGVYITVIFKN